MEIKEFVEVTVTKLTLEPNDSLIVTLKMEDVSEAETSQLAAALREKFPKNQVMIWAISPEDDIKLTVVKSPAPNECKDPAQYCSDCSCGKKERLQEDIANATTNEEEE